jgi:topoisomerase-4 subunit A
MGFKLLVFPLEQLPEMGRGRGVTLQRSKGDRLRDAQAFRFESGLPWASRVIEAAELKFWRGERAQSGRMREGKWPKKNFRGE